MQMCDGRKPSTQLRTSVMMGREGAAAGSGAAAGAAGRWLAERPPRRSCCLRIGRGRDETAEVS